MRKLLAALMVIGLLLVVGVAEAQWAVTQVLRSWDDGQTRWENGNMEMWLDGTNQPFLHSFFGPSEFNTDLITNACDPAWPEVDGTDTRYAGSALVGLYHVDTGGSLANPTGFQSTTNWRLVKCSALDPSGSASDKKYPDPADILDDCPLDNDDVYFERCEILGRDTVDQTTECGALGTGNCDYEITSTFRVNLDIDCDGILDTGYDDDVCLYFEAVKPSPAQTPWAGNLQARLEAKSGDKTDNFSVRGPNAVTVVSLSAMPRPLALPAIAGALALGAVAVGCMVLIYRRRMM